MCNNPNLDLVNINAYTKFGKILSICQDCDGRNDRQSKKEGKDHELIQSSTTSDPGASQQN